MDFNELSELLFPKIKKTAEYYLKLYPKRQLDDGAKVTRIAPSPTGFMHLGNLFGALADERIAHQSGGIFYLRIEDTDEKRTVSGAAQLIVKSLSYFGLSFDEGATAEGEIGSYGPYFQRQRVEIYQTFAKQLVKMGRAYPCFCSEEELSEMRKEQEASKANFGYFGKWAKHRDSSFEEIKENLLKSTPWVLRLKSMGNIEYKYTINDLIKGKLEVTQNEQDVVLIKSDGVPTYHFAHVIDDTLMGTTTVIRGEEWLATLPIHIELCQVLGFKPFNYAHTAHLMKLENGNKRKLSKRKDPELALSYYQEQGYAPECVIEYLMMLLNSNYEQWRLANPYEDYKNFKFSLNKMSVSGAQFDLMKLKDVSKNVLSLMSAEKIYQLVTDWAAQYDKEFYSLLASDKDKAIQILSIGRGGKKPRKDFALLSEVKEYISFFYDKLFVPGDYYPQNMSKESIKAILSDYINIYDCNDDQTVWFSKIKELSGQHGYQPDMKVYKDNPANFKGSVADVSMAIRVALTGRENSPDMYEIMKIMNKNMIASRLEAAAKLL